MLPANIVSTQMPTSLGNFRLHVWKGERGSELVALTTHAINPAHEVVVRVHSECLTGDTFHSLTCDCGSQKEIALKRIDEHGNGIFIYHRQEGRNAGLFKKVEAYNLMQAGMDTHEALLSVMNHPDPRDYSDVLTVLDQMLGGTKSKIRLLTNNPYKAIFLERHGYEVIAEPLRIGVSVHSEDYMQAKTDKFLHNTIGYAPYTSLTVSRDDIKRRTHEIATAVASVRPLPSGRKLFVGVSLFPTMDDLRSPAISEHLKNLYSIVDKGENAHLVLHLYYPLARQMQRDLKRFLHTLPFSYSLQFRLPNDASPSTRVDVDLLDSLRAQHVIFQLKKEHFFLLEQKSFTEYFSSPNKFLMLDESFGSGKGEQVRVIRERILQLVSRGLSRIAVAGGYSAENAADIHELEDYFKLPISVDAEAKLRTNGRFDRLKAQKYLEFFFQHVAP